MSHPVRFAASSQQSREPVDGPNAQRRDWAVGSATPEPDESPTPRAINLALRHIIGCLIRQPDLFHQTLSNGASFDEALLPSEIANTDLRRLYQIIYDRLASDEETLTLATLLADLAVNEEHGLANLATDAEAKAESLAGDNPQTLSALIVSETESILHHDKERRYQQSRPDLIEQMANVLPGSAQEARLTEIFEHRRDNPSPARITHLYK